MVILILLFSFAISASFVCSLCEAGFLSISRVEIARLVEQKKPAGRAIEKLKDNAEQSLSAILTLNTLANMVGAAGVGAAAGRLWGNSGVAVASGALTFAILILGEIVPKSLGSRYAYRLASIVATCVRAMRFVFYPVVVLLGGVSRLLGEAGDSQTSRADIAIFARLGYADGAIREIEATTIEHILALAETPLTSIMVPWAKVQKYPADLSVDELLQSDDPLEHSVFLACDPETSRPIGKVQRTTVYELGRRGVGEQKLADLARPVAWSPGNEGIKGLGREQFVIVEVDGEPEGIATLSDGLEFLWGEALQESPERAEGNRPITE